MTDFKTIAAGIAIAGSLGLAALGVGSGVANASPSPVLNGPGWAQDRGWGHGGGPWGGGGGGGWDRRGGDGPRWAPPDYGYGGYGGYGGGGYGGGGYGGGGCVTGPLGLLHFCP
jgi:hypothetical protein